MTSRVLIVDDDRAIVRMLQRTLEAEGFQVSLAGDGGATLARVESWPPDVVVLDRMMPGLDGPAVARRKGDAVPILMLTARDAVPDRVEGPEAGADDYLVKPSRSSWWLGSGRCCGARDVAGGQLVQSVRCLWPYPPYAVE